MTEVFTRSVSFIVPKAVRKELDAFTLGPGATVDVDIEVPVGRTGVATILKVAYDPASTAGVRLSFYYSIDGVSWDTDTDDVYTHPFGAGQTRQKTYISASLPLYIRIRIENLDTTYAVIVDLWSCFI